MTRKFTPSLSLPLGKAAPQSPTKQPAGSQAASEASPSTTTAKTPGKNLEPPGEIETKSGKKIPRITFDDSINPPTTPTKPPATPRQSGAGGALLQKSLASVAANAGAGTTPTSKLPVSPVKTSPKPAATPSAGAPVSADALSPAQKSTPFVLKSVEFKMPDDLKQRIERAQRFGSDPTPKDQLWYSKVSILFGGVFFCAPVLILPFLNVFSSFSVVTNLATITMTW